MTLPLVFGTHGAELLDEEARFFQEVQPSGFILFARNCVDKAQLTKLISDLKSTVPDADIMVDQEGGRVMRMKPPVWPTQAAPKVYGDMFDRSPIMACEALKKDTNEVAKQLKEHGFTVNIAPTCDLYVEGIDNGIGDRAFHKDPDIIAFLAEAQARTLLDAGIQPVIKHLPGHGFAQCDSHLALPIMEMEGDDLDRSLAPFKMMTDKLGSDIWGLVAHCVYPSLDHSGLPAGCSPKLIQEIIRDKIGLTGLLLSDDINMHALDVIGDLPERAKACLDAGCDLVLHCDGNLGDMKAIADSL